MAMYLLALIATIFFIRWYNRKKLDKKHRILKERFHREQEERLAKLEKEKLEREIRQKQKELARTTMNMAEKNKVILELKEMLLVNKSQFTNQKRHSSFIKKLDNSINDDGDWKHFEVNFKELHEDFFENLLKKYPNLTPKDLKLCAYLKMNLSSKEIAPLMAITNRGVEIHRDRLRKKLKIDSSQNLSNFLIKFN
jgi:DNA-binding CsgD family transcriptional regulator